MSRARPLVPFVTAALLAGCPNGDESRPWYLGVWKLDVVCEGFTGRCRDPTTDDRFQVIELSEEQFVEYRQDGTVRLSVPAGYHEAECITGQVLVNLSTEGGPDWCVSGDREYLSGGPDYYDGGGYGFRRCNSSDFC